ncbi:hypothetical protein [Butyricimonas virosa]|uniref:hypothetical protein n=1 Tax=Butyricimonas virosa TaxID=544645 RepID=UPI0020631C41|nr:MAG TPA: hypothetical protein [Caudoviricetes sp.]
MAKALAKTRKRYTPLDLVYSSSVSGALNQNYDASYQTYDPDRGLVPLEILFTVRATDTKRVIDPGVINSKLTDIKWYENVVDEAHNITDGNTAYVIDRNGNSDSRGKLTVKKNTPLEGVVLIFTAKYTDPRDGKVVNVNATISLGVTVSTDEPLRVKVDYPYGQVVDPTENRDFVEIDNILYRGDEEYEGSIYRWLKKEGGDYTAIEEGDNGITGAYTGKLKVPCHVVGKRLDLRCETDVLPDLAGVNLVSKAMISDDWNALKSGISTPGEDADGKYLAIKQMELYNAFNNGKDDIFGEKIKYKPNQCYRLDVKWKMQGEQEHGGIVFVIKYTDGSSGQLGIDGGKVSLETVRLITKPGKTVQKITSLYGTNLHDTNLYDLQLVEYHGENLVERGSKERKTSSGYVNVLNKLTATKYSLRFEKSETLEGTGITSRSAKVYDYTIGDTVSNTININDGEVGVITLKDGVDLTHDFKLLLYGKQNGMNTGVAASFHDIMLVEGEYTDETMPAYTPAADEFVPAIADGGERWQESTSKAITTDHVLSTQYPRCNTEIVAPSMILDDTSLFEASVIMHSSRGDIANPQLYWSFPWKDKTGAVFARGSKIFIKEEQFDNGEFDYSVDPVEGLNEAKWAANFNGIDQVLRNDNPVGIVPWGYGSVRTHVVEFIATAIPDEEFAILVQISGKLSSGVRGFAFAILKNGKMQYRVGGTAGEFPASLVREGTIDILPGKLYRVEVDISLDGTFKARVNGQEDSLVTKGGANYISAFIGMGGTTSANFFTGKILRYIIHDETSSIYHEWDFQPTNGDRANMLKNKNHKGSVTGNSPLEPRNIPEIDNVDPENGFFVTI